MGILTRGGFRRRLILLAAALGLAIASVIILPIGSSEAVVPVEEDAGVLLLRVDSDGDSWIRYYAAPLPLDNGNLLIDEYDYQQPIGIKRCAVSTSGSYLPGPDGALAGGDMVLISDASTPPGKGIGVVSNGLGVRTKNNCSTAQGRIDSTQQLSLALETSLSPLPDGVQIKSIEVDVEGKFNAGLGYSLDGIPQEPRDLPSTSDNGPDAGAADNSIVRIPPQDTEEGDPGPSYFSAVTFYPTNGGEIAIEGGGDGLVAAGDPSPLRHSLGVSETLFELVTVTEYDGIIDCGEQTDRVGDMETTAQARLTRGSDNFVKGGGDCTEPPIGYSLSSTVGDEQTISFEFQENLLPSWVGQFTWAPEDFPTEEGELIGGVPATRVDEDGAGPLPEAPLLWCDGFSGVTDPEILGDDNPELDPALFDPVTDEFKIPKLPGEPELPEDRSWCLLTQSTTVVGANQIQVSQTVYGLTDPFWARG